MKTSPAPHALASAAGKDATLALHRARAAGLEVRWALCMYDRDDDAVRLHGTPRPLVEAQALALGLEPLLVPTAPGAFEPAFVGALDWLAREGAHGIVFGNIHLADVRAWYEERTTGAGLRHVEPLWGEAPCALVREVLSLGYRVRVVSVDLAQGDGSWAGRELTLELLADMEAWGIDPCGERGEYHTFVWDGPLFTAPVPVKPGEVVEREGHRMVSLGSRGGLS